MKRGVPAWAAWIALFLSAGVCLAEAPKVVKVSPADGDQGVKPGAVELRVVFDRPMRPGGWSVVQSGRGVFPQLVGKPRWVDTKTFVWPMKLEPNTEYWLSINGTRFTNFRGAKGEPAVPHPVSFRTGAAADAPPAAEDQVNANRAAVDALRKSIDQDYAYRDLRKVDWDARFKEFAPKLEQARGPAEFASVAARMLSAAQDIHLTMKVGEQRVATWRRSVFSAVDGRVLERVVPQWKKHGTWVYSGAYPDGPRYLLIASLPADDTVVASALEVVGEAAKEGKGLIIDLRANGGGDEIVARRIAGCFIEKPAVYAAHEIRSEGAFSAKSNRVVQPNPDGPKFRTGRVVVLQGPGVASSCESFVLMMKQVPGCVTVGMTTAGTSGNPRTVDLGNGVSVSVPRWRALLPDGTGLEGVGIAPDVEVKVTAADLKDRDPILEEALKRAKQDH